MYVSRDMQRISLETGNSVDRRLVKYVHESEWRGRGGGMNTRENEENSNLNEQTTEQQATKQY